MTEKLADLVRRRSWDAVMLLSRSGVGYTYSVGRLDQETLDRAQAMTGAGSDAEGIVLAALQFALYNLEDFERYVDVNSRVEPGERFFIARGSLGVTPKAKGAR